MDKISCNVAKDLLPCYLDKICSEESRDLVEIHLAECASCQEFMKKLQKSDLEKEGPAVDYLKKTRLTIEFRTIGLVAASLALLIMGMLYGNQNNPAPSINYYYVEMPALMFLFAFFKLRGTPSSQPKKWEWLLPVCGGILTVSALILRLLTLKWATGSLTPPVPLGKLGPFVHRLDLLIAWGSVLLLVALSYAFQKKHRFFLLCNNLAWLSLNLAMTLDNFLYHMLSAEKAIAFMEKNTFVLLAEFIAVTFALFVIDCNQNRHGQTAGPCA